ncbi:hypothetical protein C8J56DRAFT_955650 [Mycena floridula]|nr:hypothetical protein C8J56DRAFT_955650 [Mycena floridula]
MAETSELPLLEQKLTGLVSELRQNDSDQAWLTVEATARALANGLRVKDGPVDNHTFLGKSELPATLTALFGLALHNAPVPELKYTSPALELLRVAANLCMEHDENRAQLLDAGLPQAIVSLLEGYSESLPPLPQALPAPFSIQDLKVLRTAIGVLLNASLGFDAVKFRLISLEAAKTILNLSTAIYPAGAWLSPASDSPANSSEEIEEIWTLRTTLSDWAWRTISELKDVKDETLQIFNPDVLPILCSPLALYTPPHPVSSSRFSAESGLFSTLVAADFESFEESCTLIESLALDVEDVRLSLARGSENEGSRCLEIILDFIEKGDYPPLWDILSESERKRKEKAVDMCKAALVKAVVEMAGEELNADLLWDTAAVENPGGPFVSRMVQWIKSYVRDMDEGSGPAFDRDDLLICATLSLGNLTRKEIHASLLLAPPHSLGSVLASKHLLSPLTDIKVKHGVIGLLKHLAQSSVQSPEIHTTLGNSGVIESIVECGIWDEKADAMAEVVQVSAIGVVKHLCNTIIESTFTLVLPSTKSTPPPPTGLSQILALVKRSDSVPVKSEGTRVLVNVIKTLWSNVSIAASPVTGGPSPIANGTVDSDIVVQKNKQRSAAIRVVLSPICATALASLVGRSGKYPLLVNEGVVAMSLMGTQKAGAPLILSAILTPLQIEFPPVPPTEPPSTSSSATSDLSSPVMNTPSTHHGGHLPVPRLPLDMLISVLRNVDNPTNFPVEVRINVCSLFFMLGRNASGSELARVKENVRPVLKEVLENVHDAQGKESALIKSIQKVLDAWAS